MLVLSRGKDQAIYLNDDIRIVVCGVDLRSGVVKIGIDAPAHVRVLRAELYPSQEPTKQSTNSNKCSCNFKVGDRVFSRKHGAQGVIQAIGYTLADVVFDNLPGMVHTVSMSYLSRIQEGD